MVVTIGLGCVIVFYGVYLYVVLVLIWFVAASFVAFRWGFGCCGFGVVGGWLDWRLFMLFCLIGYCCLYLGFWCFGHSLGLC